MFMKRKRKPVAMPELKSHWRADVGEYVRAVAFEKTGRVLAVATAGTAIPLIDVASGRRVRDLSGHANGVTALSWHPDGRRLASTGHDGHVRVWDTTTGTLLWASACGVAWVERCVFRTDGKLLAVAAGRTVRLYSPDGVLQRELVGHPSTVADICWRPDRNELLVARYGGLHVWNPDKSDPVQTLNYRGSVLQIAISPTGKFVATADQNSTVHFWRTRDWNHAEMSGYTHIVTTLSWDSTGRYLATDGGINAIVWDCSEPGPEGRMPIFLKGESDILTRCVAFAPDRPVCTTGNEAGVVSVHDVEGNTLQAVSPLESGITTLLWGTAATGLICGNSTGSVECFVPSGKVTASALVRPVV